MTRSELIDKTHGIMVALCGEQFDAFADDDGDVQFVTMIKGAPVVVAAEARGERESLLVGHHVIGTRIEDRNAAAEFVAQHNQQIRSGRMQLIGDSVVFFHQVFGAGVNQETVRLLLGLLAGATCFHAELAAKAGALKLTDVAALDELDEG